MLGPERVLRDMRGCFRVCVDFFHMVSGSIEICLKVFFFSGLLSRVVSSMFFFSSGLIVVLGICCCGR